MLNFQFITITTQNCCPVIGVGYPFNYYTELLSSNWCWLSPIWSMVGQGVFTWFAIFRTMHYGWFVLDWWSIMGLEEFEFLKPFAAAMQVQTDFVVPALIQVAKPFVSS